MANRLEMRGMTKRYGDFTANDNVSFTLKEGEVHAIVGENGAGKTTLMRMLYGMEQPTAGEIAVNGKPVVFRGPEDAIRHGIGMVHQHFMLFPDFTVAENIVIGYEPQRKGLFQRKEAASAVRSLSERYRIPINENAKVSSCSVGEQQRVEILKVLYQGADIIVLDEPTAVLTPLEVRELLQTIRHLAESGKSVILITHKLQEVMEVADRITVLRGGRVTGTVSRSETNADDLARMMVGRELQQLSDRVRLEGKPLLRVQGLNVREKQTLVDDVTFSVHHGEIVGIAGVSGNGQSELLEALTGLRAVSEGKVYLGEKDVTGQSVAAIREAGLAHIPEDRYLWGTAKRESVEENALMGYQRKPEYMRRGVVLRSKFRRVVEEWVERFAIKTGSLHLKEQAGNLSGGNLQKLIVARELGQNTPLLIAAEPTRGVDIGAMEYIHQALLEKRNNGDGILLVSSELTEILALSDRILVMYKGRIAGELTRSEATEEKISVLMAGGSVYGSSQAAM
ncbi:ABC transporter ATP-binding protein [Brevibacillus borstelensis]|uniref:ABC transporter ATP-binding protein n=1 Tax=Brevibacillus borstelensis TaxID=45462 RepID=UPI001D0AFF36|nr:ABC transporter ATP-binding protein [Brevibacillus borstelensis]MCC0563137.1 ABC transporter ATP-binding protein [Brevibacillus borstelensis]MED1853360.1 ABC transporter ATP-binding protein [Brevibacillus borstelensis]